MKENFRFNPSSIAGLETGRHSDPVVLGLYMAISRTGRKVWLFRRRVPQSDRTVELTFGAFPAKSIGAARRWAASLNEVIERGVDPREEARAEKARAMSALTAYAIYLVDRT